MTLFSSIISVLALVVSAVTAWLTLFRVGSVKMSQPTVIFFGPDSGGDLSPKIYLRTLLFSTSKRGCVIESMHVALHRDETRQNFNVWVYGEERLMRGSGLFVGETGVATNHHFLAPRGDDPFRFIEGRYLLEVFAKLVGRREQILLFSQHLEISKEIGLELKEPGTGVYFDWGPDASRYLSHSDKRPPTQSAMALKEMLDLLRPSQKPGKGNTV